MAGKGDDGFISREMSIYLDLVRFLAALAVVIVHGIQDKLYNGFYPLSNLSHEAVLAFFVLSGLVISATASRPSETGRSFAVARIARIYSVALPAIIFSFVLVAVALAAGLPVDPEASADFTSWSAVSSALFLNELWTISAGLPWNLPYWSLCYEVWYYLIFAILFFGKAAWRWPLAAAAILAAGPRVLALAPIWALGVWIYTDARLRIRSAYVGALVAGASLVAILIADRLDVTGSIRTYMSTHVPGWWRLHASTKCIWDNVTGLLIAAHFIGMRACIGRLNPLLVQVERPVRYLAGSTFSLYLFHRPITKMLAALGVSTDPFIAYTAILLAIVGLCFALATVTERKRAVARRIVERLLPSLDRSSVRAA